MLHGVLAGAVTCWTCHLEAIAHRQAQGVFGELGAWRSGAAASWGRLDAGEHCVYRLPCLVPGRLLGSMRVSVCGRQQSRFFDKNASALRPRARPVLQYCPHTRDRQPAT